MFITRPATVALAVALSPVLAATTPIQKSYDRLIAFGASYLDNAHKQPEVYDTRLAGPPNFEGRFGNGPVISEYMALDLGLIASTNNSDEDGDGSGWRFIDFAYAGAVVSNKFDLHAMPDIHQQFRQFGKFVANGTYPTNFTPATTSSTRRQRRHGEAGHHKRSGLPPVLVLAEIGLNTMVDIWRMPLNTSDPSSVAQRDANITSQTKSLQVALHHLARSEEIHSMSPTGTLDVLVFGQFPLDKIPNFSQNPGNMTELRREINLWNANVNKTLVKLNDESTNGDRWLGWNADLFFDDVFANPAKYNMTDVKDACVNFQTQKPCDDPSKFLWWDSVHLTTTAASFVADNILKTAYVADSAAISIDVDVQL